MICIDTLPCTIWFWLTMSIEIVQAAWPVFAVLGFIMLSPRARLALVAIALIALCVSASARVPDPPRWWTDQDDPTLRCYRFKLTGDKRKDAHLRNACINRWRME